jgi:alkylation response protein AidB-like acyl-CoA dehydrogenase
VRAAFSPAEEAFRAEVRGFLGEWRDVDGYLRMGSRWERVTALWRAMGERGWLSLSWPREHGGLGLSATHEYLLWDEAAHARAARAPLDAGIVAKSLLRYGSEAQKQRWLPGIRRGETAFSLGYSEPEAGSDLASVRTRAERRGDAYLVTGEKCWTSYAERTAWLWTLVRTGAPESRGEGLSLLIVELRAPGVTVEALPTLDGEQLNAIRLDGVEVPLERRVGPEHGAWKIMAEALADERHVQFPPGRLRRDLDDLAEDVRGRGLAGDPLARRTLADLSVRVLECEVHALRVLDAMLHGRSDAALAAANKVAHTEAAQEIARAALELGGPEALLAGSRPDVLWRQSLWETIGGGTSEIMRGVVARHGLGLR